MSRSVRVSELSRVVVQKNPEQHVQNSTTCLTTTGNLVSLGELKWPTTTTASSTSAW